MTKAGKSLKFALQLKAVTCVICWAPQLSRDLSLVLLVKAVNYRPDIVILLLCSLIAVKDHFRNLDAVLFTWNKYVYFL